MESQHMTQQAFSQFTGISSSVLSGIFTGRTKPTIKQVEAIRKKIPNINLSWLLFGEGGMYISESQDTVQNQAIEASPTPSEGQEVTTDHKYRRNNGVEGFGNDSKGTRITELKKLDMQKRRITEIRVFYDDNTYEAFVAKTT